MYEFIVEMQEWFHDEHVNNVHKKSMPWDDGYSIEEITSHVNYENVRFSIFNFLKKIKDKVVIFFPNRISPSSDDYTRGMKFMLEVLPTLRRYSDNFVVVAGNPNMKLSNKELDNRCSEFGYYKLHKHTLNRDEYKLVASLSDIVVGLYDEKSDAYGGTASRECIELGSIPLWPRVNEYEKIACKAKFNDFLVKPDLSDIVSSTLLLIDYVRTFKEEVKISQQRLKDVVRQTCSFESTTKTAMEKMELL
jgi:hypothetical protein